jgi:phosphoglycerol transferase MdoB-like AlkP superfamily enzyme
MWFLAYFILHLAVYSSLRLQFLWWNWDSLSSSETAELLWALFYGLRFDLSVLAYTLGLAVLGLFWLPARWSLNKIYFWLFAALNSALIIVNFIDAELINFTAKRFSSATLYLVGEGGVSNLLLPYIPLVMVSVFIFSIYAYVLYRLSLSAKLRPPGGLFKKISLSVALLAVAVVMARGGLQLKPLTYVDAKLFNSTYANNLVLNSSFTFLKSLGKPSLERKKYFPSGELLGFLNEQNLAKVQLNLPRHPNVVLLILESFSSEYTELRNPEVTPFLNSLARKSVSFNAAYANGRRSIEGVAALLSGIPALMEEPFISSEFSANQLIGLGTLLESQGYHTSFFHGTKNGSMHFDRFTKSVGITNYFGLSEYPETGHYDGTWGIFDEEFLNWSCKKMSAFPQPFFSSVFTLSSHQPFKIPQRYEARFADQRHEILKSVRYADHALQEFFRCAEQQSWFGQTIFILTADHTGPALKPVTEFAQNYRVPLVIYSPIPGLGSDSSVDQNQLAQHIDVLPTVLDLLNIEYKNKNYLARSLLRTGPKLIALYGDHQYQLLGDITDNDLQLKAVQQYFSEGLYDNRLYYPAK